MTDEQVTIDDIRTMAQRCGLRDPVLFAAEGGAHRERWTTFLASHDEREWDMNRGTGRTTRAVLRAMVLAEAGKKVLFVTRNGMSHYAADAIAELGRAAQIDTLRIRVSILKGPLRGWDSEVVTDHAVRLHDSTGQP